MLLNVYSTESQSVIQIDSADLNPEIHLHLVAKTKFSQEDLDSFGYVAKKSRKKEVVEEVAPEVPEVTE